MVVVGRREEEQEETNEETNRRRGMLGRRMGGRDVEAYERSSFFFQM